jgi:hypothetical protein
MINARFTLAPRQSNTREEKKSFKNGEGNNLWNYKTNTKTLMLVGQRKKKRLYTAIEMTQK